MHAIEAFGRQIQEAVEAAKDLTLSPPKREIRNVVVSGMGSAGTGAQLVASLIAEQLPVPFLIHQHYYLPAFINEYTLFIAASFSGDTAETLAVLDEALTRGAMVVIMAGGGTMAELAVAKAIPFLKIPYEKGLESAHVGHYAVQLLFLLYRYQLTNDAFISQLGKLVDLIEERESVIKEGARDLAETLAGNVPVICGDAKLYGVMAHFMHQLNCYAQQFAHLYILPEINHHEIAGFVHPNFVIDKAMMVLVQTDYDHPKVEHSLAIGRNIFSPKAAALIEVLILYGDSALEQYFYLIHLFDWTAFYLAQQNGTNPLDTQLIDDVKDELSKSD